MLLLAFGFLFPAITFVCNYWLYFEFHSSNGVFLFSEFSDSLMVIFPDAG